ncbi:MAG TPA: STAS domain-containing protein [Thermoanaerobaculia bacterium]|nr:STAS domain-containing protein [Thermoanaerobaculia bacterium]
MSESLQLDVDRREGVAVLYTEGYINNQGGEEIARVAYQLLEEGYKTLLLNLRGTKIVNSIGISILIEIIEKMIEIDGRLAFCCLTPTIEKTFHIMGLAQYAGIYSDEESALAALAALGRSAASAATPPATPTGE